MCSLTDTEHYAALGGGILKFTSSDGTSFTKLLPTGQNPSQQYNSVFAFFEYDIPSTASMKNVFVISKDIIRLEFSSNISASRDFWKTSSYSIVDNSGSTFVEIKEVRPVHQKATLHVYLKVIGLKWGNTYTVTIAADKIFDINAAPLGTGSISFNMERTKTDSIISTFANLYAVETGANLRSIIEAISIEDEKIGGNF
jgi:hypothetical protein